MFYDCLIKHVKEGCTHFDPDYVAELGIMLKSAWLKSY